MGLLGLTEGTTTSSDREKRDAHGNCGSCSQADTNLGHAGDEEWRLQNLPTLPHPPGTSQLLPLVFQGAQVGRPHLA